MLTLIVFLLASIIVRFFSLLAFAQSFSMGRQLTISVVLAIAGALVCYFAHQFNWSGPFFDAALVVGTLFGPWLLSRIVNIKTGSDSTTSIFKSSMLCSIIDFGKNGYGIMWVIYALLSIFLIVQSAKEVRDPKSSYYKKPLYKAPEFLIFIVVSCIAVIIHFLIAASYK